MMLSDDGQASPIARQAASRAAHAHHFFEAADAAADGRALRVELMYRGAIQ